MPLDIRLKPVESLLFRSDVVAVGKFRCPATHPLFRDSGPCSHHTFAFPRTVTQIRHEGGATFVGSPGGVALYNQHQLYTRTKINDIDATDWYTVADDVLMDIVSGHDAAATPQRPFTVADVPCDARSYIEQRMLFDHLDRGREIDPMQVEETVLRVVSRILARRRVTLKPAHVDAIEHARAFIACDPSRNTTLRALARECDISPFQLCRMFRARTGETMTRYRHSLRLRLALDRLRDRRVDLTDLALDLGYSSHSHFTFVFRRHFGITPSAFRDDCRSAGC